MVGSGRRLLDNGETVAPEVKEGDSVVFQEYGSEIKRGEETYLILNVEDILAIIEK